MVTTDWLQRPQMKTTFLRGFSLIEAMITLFILTTGLLGVAASQGIAKKSAFESQQRTLASFIAMDIAERIHLNSSEFINAPDLYAVSSVIETAKTLTQPKCSSCSASERRTIDLIHWQNLLKGTQVSDNARAIGGLTKADACIGYETTSGLVTIIISWQSRQQLEDGADTSVTLAKNCGAESKERRQITITTLVRNA